jgi:putative ABC transport system permease protein
VLTITLRDLQFRRRQFAVAVVGASLVFALTLVLTGMSAGFRFEARETVGAIDADAWIVTQGVRGPFTSATTLPEDIGRGWSGVRRAEPLVEFGEVARLPDGSQKNVNVIGHRIGPPGDPDWEAGRGATGRGCAVVDERLGVEADETITIGAQKLCVDSVTSDRTYFAGVPIVFVTLRDAQEIAFEGRPLATTIVTQGRPRRPPADFQVVSNEQVRADLLQPLDGAKSAIDTVRVLMWLVAVAIIGAVVYLSALERLRDFAVLKAVGGSSRSLALSLAIEAVLASVLAALLGTALAQVLKPLFPMPVVIEGTAYVGLAAIAIAVGVISSLAALRRALRVDPALAFAG